MTLRRLVKVLFAVLVLLALTTATVIVVAAQRRRTLVNVQRNRFDSYQLADMLRQSSDELTRFARTYVATGDPKFEQYYRDVIAIRSGQKAMPQDYQRVYWDLFIATGAPPRPDGPTISLVQLMREAGFSEQEMAKLKDAESASNALVRIEETAMHAVRGEYPDATGAFTRTGAPDQALATRLLYDDTYHREKARIMAPIDEFLEMVEVRTTSELDQFTAQTAVAFAVIEGLLVVFVGIVLVSYPIMRRRVLEPIAVLQRQTMSVATDLERLAGVTTQIAGGNLGESFSVSATPINWTRPDEVGDLTRVHDAMIGQLQKTGTATAAITANLSLAHHRLEEILNTTPIAVGVSVDGICRFANSRFRELFGAVVGQPVVDLYINAEDRLHVIREVETQGIVRDFPVQARAADGRAIELLGTFYRIEFEGKPGILAWMVDVSRLMETERALRQAKHAAEAATEAKSGFLAHMSHEIRTPMNAIIGMTHLALQRELSAQVRDYLTKAHGAADSLLRILNDILDFSKIEAGAVDLETTDFSLDETLEGVAHLMAARAQEKGVELLFDRGRDVPTNLRGDPLRLTQVLTNLASNAVKFTESGEIVLTVDLVSHTGDAVTLKFAVRDTGIGMTPEQMSRLFQPFSQADMSTTRRFGGTGLGLSICKRLVDLMGGEIHAESESGVGSTFVFTATFARADAPPAATESALPILSGLRVLAVDDSETSRRILQALLTELDCHVTTASSGREALALLEAGAGVAPVTMVLLDWKMTGLDGLETLSAIRASPSRYGAPKVVMVTAYGRQDVLERAAGLDVAGLVVKPVTRSVLANTLLSALGHSAVPAPGGGFVQAITSDDFAGATVLAVEDQPINQQIIREILESAGLRVELANNGQEAVDAVAAKDYDAVLMDVQMPVMDGLEAARRIRAGRDARVPIIAMTAHAMKADMEQSLAAGMNDHVTKPIDPRGLFIALRKWMRPRMSGPAAVSAAGTAAGAETVTLPAALPGIDLKDGLDRVNGNAVLYRSVLVAFRAEFASAPGQIREALQDDRQSDAARILHSLKGVAANVGARLLAEAAEAVASAIRRSGSEDVLVAVSRLEIALDEVIRGLAVFGAQPGVLSGPLTAAAVGAVSAQTRARLLAATIAADHREVTRIIDEIAADHPHVASGLRTLADDFAFETLRDLLREC